jgi:hypothetical protein
MGGSLDGRIPRWEDPSMLSDGPIPPSSEIEEISVTFLPQLRGAEPMALRPLGALP